MKIGIFGGSFNPIHLGHIRIIDHVLDSYDLDKLIVIPVGRASHKNIFEEGSHRLNMTKLALSNREKVDVSSIEIDSPNTSYTYNTLCELKKIYKNANYYEIIGGDSANYLESWKKYDTLVEEAKFIVLKRRGYEYIPPHSNIEVLETPLLPYSSTEIRKLVREGKPIAHLVSTRVEEYIKKHNLYKEV